MTQHAKNCEECQQKKHEYHGKKQGEVFVLCAWHKPYQQSKFEKIK